MAMKLIKSERAVVFTVAAALFAVVILSLVVISSAQRRAEGNTAVYVVRGEEMDNFLDDISHDLGRASRIAGTRAMVYAIGTVVSNGTPLENATLALEEMALNGTLNGVEVPTLENHSLSDWAERMNGAGDSQGFLMNLSAEQMNVRFAPYNGSFSFMMQAKIEDLYVNDSYGYFSFSGDLPRHLEWRTEYVSVEGLEDPLYVLNTWGHVSRLINKSVYEPSKLGDSDKMIESIQNKSYFSNQDGPCIFERLEGKLGDPEDSSRHQYYIDLAYDAMLDEGLNISKSNLSIGLETFVNVNELESRIPADAKPYIIKTNQTVVDHLYFGPYVTSKKMTNVTSLYPWFRIDLNHSTFYGVNESQLYD